MTWYGVFVVFWIAAIFGFLYVPTLFQVFENKRSINVFMWSGVVDTKVLGDFEKETGIKVNVNYFEGNDELIVKVLATKGKGYDMIVPSDYAVTFFTQHGLLKKIDTKKLDFWDHIDPKFLNHWFDPKNEYSVPAEWYVLGLGINKKHFPHGLPEASLKTLFEPSGNYRIGTINDSKECAGLAVKYRYGQVRPINSSETQEIKQLLMRQKKYVEAYTDFRGDFLLESGNCSVVLAPISAIWKTIESNDSVAFLLPKEGTFLGLENYAILESSTKEDLVYQFMNYLFRLEVQKHNFQHRILLSTRSDADFVLEHPILRECFEKIGTGEGGAELFEHLLTDEQVNDIWMAVKGL
jgi:spermidine/putrescine transport system substrate-binding protein